MSRDTIHRLERDGLIELASLATLLDAMGYRVSFTRKQYRSADMRRDFAHLHEDAD